MKISIAGWSWHDYLLILAAYPSLIKVSAFAGTKLWRLFPL